MLMKHTDSLSTKTEAQNTTPEKTEQDKPCVLHGPSGIFSATISREMRGTITTSFEMGVHCGPLAIANSRLHGNNADSRLIDPSTEDFFSILADRNHTLQQAICTEPESIRTPIKISEDYDLFPESPNRVDTYVRVKSGEGYGFRIEVDTILSEPEAIALAHTAEGPHLDLNLQKDAYTLIVDFLNIQKQVKRIEPTKIKSKEGLHLNIARSAHNAFDHWSKLGNQLIGELIGDLTREIHKHNSPTGDAPGFIQQKLLNLATDKASTTVFRILQAPIKALSEKKLAKAINKKQGDVKNTDITIEVVENALSECFQILNEQSFNGFFKIFREFFGVPMRTVVPTAMLNRFALSALFTAQACYNLSDPYEEKATSQGKKLSSEDMLREHVHTLLPTVSQGFPSRIQNIYMGSEFVKTIQDHSAKSSKKKDKISAKKLFMFSCLCFAESSKDFNSWLLKFLEYIEAYLAQSGLNEKYEYPNGLSFVQLMLHLIQNFAGTPCDFPQEEKGDLFPEIQSNIELLLGIINLLRAIHTLPTILQDLNDNKILPQGTNLDALARSVLHNVSRKGFTATRPQPYANPQVQEAEAHLPHVITIVTSAYRTASGLVNNHKSDAKNGSAHMSLERDIQQTHPLQIHGTTFNEAMGLLMLRNLDPSALASVAHSTANQPLIRGKGLDTRLSSTLTTMLINAIPRDANFALKELLIYAHLTAGVTHCVLSADDSVDSLLTTNTYLLQIPAIRAHLVLRVNYAFKREEDDVFRPDPILLPCNIDGTKVEFTAKLHPAAYLMREILLPDEQSQHIRLSTAQAKATLKALRCLVLDSPPIRKECSALTSRARRKGLIPVGIRYGLSMCTFPTIELTALAVAIKIRQDTMALESEATTTRTTFNTDDWLIEIQCILDAATIKTPAQCNNDHLLGGVFMILAAIPPSFVIARDGSVMTATRPLDNRLARYAKESLLITSRSSAPNREIDEDSLQNAIILILPLSKLTSSDLLKWGRRLASNPPGFGPEYSRPPQDSYFLSCNILTFASILEMTETSMLIAKPTVPLLELDLINEQYTFIVEGLIVKLGLFFNMLHRRYPRGIPDVNNSIAACKQAIDDFISAQDEAAGTKIIPTLLTRLEMSDFGDDYLERVELLQNRVIKLHNDITALYNTVESGLSSIDCAIGATAWFQDQTQEQQQEFAQFIHDLMEYLVDIAPVGRIMNLLERYLSECHSILSIGFIGKIRGSSLHQEIANKMREAHLSTITDIREDTEEDISPNLNYALKAFIDAQQVFIAKEAQALKDNTTPDLTTGRQAYAEEERAESQEHQHDGTEHDGTESNSATEVKAFPESNEDRTDADSEEDDQGALRGVEEERAESQEHQRAIIELGFDNQAIPGSNENWDATTEPQEPLHPEVLVPADKSTSGSTAVSDLEQEPSSLITDTHGKEDMHTIDTSDPKQQNVLGSADAPDPQTNIKAEALEANNHDGTEHDGTESNSATEVNTFPESNEDRTDADSEEDDQGALRGVEEERAESQEHQRAIIELGFDNQAIPGSNENWDATTEPQEPLHPEVLVPADKSTSGSTAVSDLEQEPSSLITDTHGKEDMHTIDTSDPKQQNVLGSADAPDPQANIKAEALEANNHDGTEHDGTESNSATEVNTFPESNEDRTDADSEEDDQGALRGVEEERAESQEHQRAIIELGFDNQAIPGSNENWDATTEPQEPLHPEVLVPADKSTSGSTAVSDLEQEPSSLITDTHGKEDMHTIDTSDPKQQNVLGSADAPDPQANIKAEALEANNHDGTEHDGTESNSATEVNTFPESNEDRTDADSTHTSAAGKANRKMIIVGSVMLSIVCGLTIFIALTFSGVLKLRENGLFKPKSIETIIIVSAFYILCAALFTMLAYKFLCGKKCSKNVSDADIQAEQSPDLTESAMPENCTLTDETVSKTFFAPSTIQTPIENKLSK